MGFTGKYHTEKTKKTISNANGGKNNYMYGKNHSDETKTKISNTRKLYRQRDSERMKAFWNDPIKRKKIVEGIQRYYKSAEAKQMVNKRNEKLYEDPDILKKRRDSIRKAYKENPDYIKKILVKSGKHPNNAEKDFINFLNIKYPNEWQYVGDGSLVINGKNPDFINHSKKLIIELWGNLWHIGQNPEDRIKIFEPYGYRTLIVKSDEVRKKNIDMLGSKVESFIYNYNNFIDGNTHGIQCY